jgi:Transposase
MDVLYPYCAGIDVHKKRISVCLLSPGAGHQPQQQTRDFGTTTRELLDLADWLLQNQVTHVGMESTGVYWKPIWNILEAAGFTLTLANAQHVKKALTQHSCYEVQSRRCIRPPETPWSPAKAWLPRRFISHFRLAIRNSIGLKPFSDGLHPLAWVSLRLSTILRNQDRTTVNFWVPTLHLVARLLTLVANSKSLILRHHRARRSSRNTCRVLLHVTSPTRPFSDSG